MSRIISLEVKPGESFRLWTDPYRPTLIRDLAARKVQAYFLGLHNKEGSDAPWLRVILDDQVGWIYLGIIEKMFELDIGKNGEVQESQVYPHAEED